MVEFSSIRQQTIQQTEMASSTSSASAASSAQQVETGSFMGFQVEVQPDATAMLQDSMEEIASMFEEKTTKKMGERKLGEEKKTDFRNLQRVQMWTEKLPDMPDSAVMARMLRQIRNAKGTMNMDSLLKLLQDASGDPTHQFAMLECLEEALSGDELLQQTIQDAKQQLQQTKGAEIRVGLNLAELLQDQGLPTEELQDMRDMYRGEILGYENPQSCFKSLLAAKGEEGLGKALDFLLSACSVDMEATTPSTSMEELRRIVVDLQNVEVLKTVMERMTKLCMRMEGQFGETMLMNGAQTTEKLLDMTQQAFLNGSVMEAFVSATGLKKFFPKMDFMRELSALIRAMSMRCFPDPESRLKMIDSAQEYLDQLVAAEDSEDQDDEEFKKLLL